MEYIESVSVHTKLELQVSKLNSQLCISSSDSYEVNMSFRSDFKSSQVIFR